MTRLTPQEKTGASSVIQRPWLKSWFKALLLIAMTLAAYWPAMHGGFVWDDNEHITDNMTLRSLRGLGEIWFNPGATCQYYPLSFTGFWAGFQLWGLNPLGYHLLNAVLHSLVAVLLWQVLTRLKARGAWLAGAIFALHPVCVMSVAWMTELKNTLSASLALGAGWAYLRFAGLGVYEKLEPVRKAARSAPGTPVSASSTTAGAANRTLPKRVPAQWYFYALSLVLFQLGLFAKTAVSFLPVSLLLVTWWQRERLRWRDVWPLIPMLGLAVAMGQLTFYIEHLHGAAGGQFKMGFGERVLISGRSFWFYLGKLFFPQQLTFIYERWQVDAGAPWQYLYPIATAALLIGLWWGRRRIGRGLLVALLHFYVCTSLLILLVVLYMTRYSFVSDHWQYFGCMSVVALAAAGITAMLDLFRKKRPFLEPALCGTLLLTLGVLTWRQCGMYADVETLWRKTLARNPGCWMAHNNLGVLLRNQGRREEAIEHYHMAIQINPNHFDALDNLGVVLADEGRFDEAIENYQKAIQINPDYFDALNNLGVALAAKGRFDEAIENYQKAIRINPNYFKALSNLGVALASRGRFDEAIKHLRKAIQINPDYFEALSNLGLVLAAQGQFDEAIENYRKAIQINPNSLGALSNLGVALAARGQFDEAIKSFRKAIQINPNSSDALNNLAWVLATNPNGELRNGTEAARLAERACRLTHYGQPLLIRTLAAAYAECGHFPEAVAMAEKAEQLATTAGLKELAGKNRQLLELYRDGKPYHESPPAASSPLQTPSYRTK
jgi:Flp pilus assembly protein TadD